MRRTPKRFGVRYPWREWFERHHFRLVQGKHYEQRTFIMAQMCRNRAQRGVEGMPPFSVKIRIAEDEKSFTVMVVYKSRKGGKGAHTDEPTEPEGLLGN